LTSARITVRTFGFTKTSEVWVLYITRNPESYGDPYEGTRIVHCWKANLSSENLRTKKERHGKQETLILSLYQFPFHPAGLYGFRSR